MTHSSRTAKSQQGGQGLAKGLGIGLGARGRQHVIQYHHIFPKAVLRDAGYELGEINEIANLAFLSGRTNQRLGKRPPSDYFPDIVERRGEDALASQLIPLNLELHRVENFRMFLEERRRLLAEAISSHIEAAKGG